MPHEATTYSLLPDEKQKIAETIQAFCFAETPENQNFFVHELKNQLIAYHDLHSYNKQALGAWVNECLQELIPNIHNLKQTLNLNNTDFVFFLMNLPFDEESSAFKSMLETISPEEIMPLSPEEYIHLMQTSVLLIELGSEHAQPFLDKLNQINFLGEKPSGHSIYIQMLNAKAMQIMGRSLEEQLTWLDLITKSWHVLDSTSIVYFLVQWVISLSWIRPSSIRKDLLILLNEKERHTNSYNQAIIQFELFNLPDKTITTGEKLNYLGKLRNMPAVYFTIEQLQNMYYFSGNIKSSIESSFMESVSDFQYSNYYIHKRWGWIKAVNHYFMNLFNAEDYMCIQTRIELKILDLINMINIQSNAFVETLQANFIKIEDLYHQVEDLSLRDTLTGLYNRRYLYNNINELLLLAARHQAALSFVMIDIDDFKPINDTYGHLAGDYILSELSVMLKNHFRKSDFIIRYGGEEFLIVLFESDHIQSGLTLENLRADLENHEFIYQHQNLHITISIGIASCIFENALATINLEKIISEADDALYDSKRNGKNRITVRDITY